MKKTLSTLFAALVSTALWAQEPAPAAQPAPAEPPAPAARPAPAEAPAPELNIVRQPVLTGTFSAGHYLIDGPKVVPPGEVLVLEPGVQFRMLGENAGIDVRGALVAQGERENPVRFVSAVEQSIPGAWRGLTVAPGGRVDLRHAEIRHARRAVSLEDAEAWLDRAKISESSEAAVFAVGSSAYLTDCEIGGDSPKAAAIVGTHGSRIGAERGRIHGSGIGIAASGYSMVDLVDAKVEDNATGLLLVDSVGVNLSGAKISGNAVGAATTFEVRKRPGGVAGALGLFGDERLFGLPPEVGGNRGDWSLLSGDEGRARFDSLAAGVGDERLLVRPEGYSGGVSSEGLTMPTVDHFGSLTLGVEYHHVNTAKNRTGRPVVVEGDSVAPGERYPNRHHVEGYRPYASYYSQTRFGTERMLEVQAEVAWDDWADWTFKPISLVWESPMHHLKLGHFYEEGNPVVVNDLPLLGAGYTVNTPLTALRRRPLASATVVLGEVKQPLSEGDRNPDLFGDVVLPGEAVAQELFLLTRLTFSPFGGGELAAGFTRNWDRRKDPYVRDQISDRSLLEDDPVDAKGLFGEFSWTSSGGELEIRAAMLYGFADSTQRSWNLAVERWLEENNVFIEADTVRALLLRRNLISSAQLERVLPPRLGKSGTQVVEEVRALSRTLKDSLTDEYVSGFELSGDRIGAEFEVDWRHAKSAVDFGARFLGRQFVSPGSPDLVSNRREYYLKMSQGVSDWWKVLFDGRLSVEDASADSRQLNFFGFGEGSIAGIDVDRSNLALLDENRVRPKTSLDMRLDNRWNLPAGFGLDLGYAFGHRQRRTTRLLLKDTSAFGSVVDDPLFDDASAWKRYANLPDTLARGFVQKLEMHSVSARLSWSRGPVALSAGSELRWDSDLSDFDHWSVEKSDWKLRDTTWGKMGYEFGRNDAFVVSVPLEFRLRRNSVSNRLAGRITSREYAEYDRSEGEWALTETLEWRAIPSKLSLIPETGLTYRAVDRRVTDGAGTHMRKYAEEYTDFYATLGSRYAITPRWSMRAAARWDLIERTGSPEDDVTDLSADFSTTYEF